MQWFAISLTPLDESLSGDELDSICAELMERGAQGATIASDRVITCYIEGDRTRAEQLAEALSDLRCRRLSLEPVKEENWTAACPDVWAPIRAGSIEIVPVESSTDPRPIPSGALKLIPGLGFGTGHHPTTRMVLSQISDMARAAALPIHKVLDLGTGSGILAIAAASLLGCSVDGTDIDEAAIENARENVALNGLGEKISLSTLPLQELSSGYDLILANVYGEVLANLAPEVTRLAKPGAMAILSGITELVFDHVVDTYVGTLGWELRHEQTESGWVCAVLARAKA